MIATVEHAASLGWQLAGTTVVLVAEIGPPAPGAEPGPGLTLVLADEFGATLDRTTAAALARNVRRWVSSNPEICFVAATTHDDLLEALDPDVLIEKRLGGQIAVAHRPDPSPPDEPEAQASGHDAEDRSR